LRSGVGRAKVSSSALRSRFGNAASANFASSSRSFCIVSPPRRLKSHCVFHGAIITRNARPVNSVFPFCNTHEKSKRASLSASPFVYRLVFTVYLWRTIFRFVTTVFRFPRGLRNGTHRTARNARTSGLASSSVSMRWTAIADTRNSAAMSRCDGQRAVPYLTAVPLRVTRIASHCRWIGVHPVWFGVALRMASVFSVAALPLTLTPSRAYSPVKKEGQQGGAAYSLSLMLTSSVRLPHPPPGAFDNAARVGDRLPFTLPLEGKRLAHSKQPWKGAVAIPGGDLARR